MRLRLGEQLQCDDADRQARERVGVMRGAASQPAERDAGQRASRHVQFAAGAEWRR